MFPNLCNTLAGNPIPSEANKFCLQHHFYAKWNRSNTQLFFTAPKIELICHQLLVAQKIAFSQGLKNSVRYSTSLCRNFEGRFAVQ
jgi:hypothetical protein